MDQLPNPLPAGPIHHYQAIPYEQIEGNRYYYVREQKPTPGGEPAYIDHIVFTKTDLEHGRVWKNEREMIIEGNYQRSYKRVVNIDILAADGILPGQLQNDRVVTMRELYADVGFHPRFMNAWKKLPYAMANGEFVVGPWAQIRSEMLFDRVHVKTHPELDESAYTFYAPVGQAGGQRSRRTRRHRMRRRRSNRRRHTRVRR